MIIEDNKVVAIDYILKNKDGDIIDESKNAGPLEYLQGHHDIIIGLEKALLGKSEGDKVSVVIEPAEAYGEIDPNLIVDVQKDGFPPEITVEVGMQFQTESGHIVTVKKINEDTVTVDANHFLAGEQLFFDVTIVSVRDATEDEIANGLYRGCGCGGCGGDCGSGDCNCEGGCGGDCGCGN